MAKRGYDHGVHRALATAGLYFAGVAPAVQFAVFRDSTPEYPHPGVVWSAFAVHAIVWGCAVLRRLPAPMVLVSWSAIGVSVAAQTAAAGVAEPFAPLNISLTIAATSALVLSMRRALTVTVTASVASAAAMVLAAQPAAMTVWSIAVQMPLYAVTVATALALAFRKLRKVACEADDQARARIEIDRTVRRKELAAEASRYRARMMHDTIVNTLGAIANGRIASGDDLVARRCADDARMVDVLRRSAPTINPSVRDVLTHAQEFGVDVTVDNITGLEDRLSVEEPWRRREIIAALNETVTNVAKHAGVSRARMSYDTATFTVTVSDAGVGMADVEPLARSLSLRSRDAQSEVCVTTDPGGGTTVELRIAPLRDPAAGLLASAAAGMATVISAVMLIGFAAMSMATLAFGGDWSVSAVAPPAVMWLVVAAALALILRSAGKSPVLPVSIVACAYLALVVMTVLYNLAGKAPSVCGLRPDLVWVGEAAATICAVMVLVDGRVRVVLPMVLLTVVVVVVTLRTLPVECVSATLGTFATDVLVIGAFYILRRKTWTLSKAVADYHNDQIRAREQQERLAIEEALDNDGFDATLEFSKEILCAVAEQPEHVCDPRTRVAAGLEEGYLRALIGLTTDIVTAGTKQLFVGAIDSARAAGVRISVNAEPGVLDDDSAGFLVTTVRAIIDRCAVGDEVSIGVFGPTMNPAMIIVAPPHSLDGYSFAADTHMAQMTVTAESGLIEARWSVGTHRDRR